MQSAHTLLSTLRSRWIPLALATAVVGSVTTAGASEPGPAAPRLSVQSQIDAPPPAPSPAPTPCAAPQVRTAGDATIEICPVGTSFRWSDADWIAQTSVAVVNRGNGALTVDPAWFVAQSNGNTMPRWVAASTIQNAVTLAPGQRLEGTLAWFYNRALARPNVLTVSAPFVAAVQIETQSGQDMASWPPALPAGVRVSTHGAATSFRWSDRDWIARVEVTVENAGNEPVTVDPALFHATSNDQEMTRWAPAASFDSAMTLAPGQRTTGTLAWYYNRSLARPTVVSVTAAGPQGAAFAETFQTRREQDMASAARE